jgi:hypothetical protein
MASITYDQLDTQVDQAVERITKERSRKQATAIGLLAAAVVAILGLTYAMYTYTPGSVSPDRIGTGSMQQQLPQR